MLLGFVENEAIVYYRAGLGGLSDQGIDHPFFKVLKEGERVSIRIHLNSMV